MKRLLLECLLVAVTGLALSFAANALSPRRIDISRNYFPVDKSPAPAATNAVNVAARTNALELLAERLKLKGITLADSNRVAQLYHDPRYQADLVIFIDARDESHYQRGHIPRAYQFDYYDRPERFLPVILPASTVAQEILIYCNGGTCEDSEFAAKFLLDSGVPAQKLLVYGGGFTEWATNSMPIEVGERNSGRLAQSTKP